MPKPTRSNTPLALSVVSVTKPGDVRFTADRMLEFDDARIGFTHAHTWGAMPAARRGIIKSGSSHLFYPGTHPRVEDCIRALCELGEREPVDTKRFQDHPGSGLTTNRSLEWAPSVKINVKAVCWHVQEGAPVIPLLQPRKLALPEEALAMYATLGSLAYCQGDWASGRVELVDLSGKDEVYATVIRSDDLRIMSDERVNEYVQTYLEAKKLVDAVKATRPKQTPKPKGDNLFDPAR